MRFFWELTLLLATFAFSFYINSQVESGKLIKRKTMLYYGVILSFVFTSVIILTTESNIIAIGEGLLLGIVLSIPYIFHVLKKHSEEMDSNLYYKPKRHTFWKSYLPFFILGGIILYWTSIGTEIVNAKWPLLGICFSWVTVQLFALLNNLRTEKKR